MQRPSWLLPFRRLKALVRLADAKLHDPALLTRYGAHLAVLALTVSVATVNHWDLNRLLPQPVPTPSTPQRAFVWQGQPAAMETSFNWRAVPLTVIAQRPAVARSAPVQYAVGSGDTLTSIAQRFSLQPSTIIWANAELEKNTDLLALGQELTIPPIDGVWYMPQAGDTLETLAATFQVDLNTILNYIPNHLSPGQALASGQPIMVPNGQKPYIPPPPPPMVPQVAVVQPKPAPKPAVPAKPRVPVAPKAPAPAVASTFKGATGAFRWPVSGKITTQPSSWHMALDIANTRGTPVVAADAGIVVFAGWDTTGYGYSVVLDHGNGYRSRYAHFDSYYVRYGDAVKSGQVIGKLGSTGHSSGPHLHFEILLGNSRKNPYNFLP